MSVCRVSPLQCPLDCSGRGNCVNGVCMCTPPLLPPDCATAACPNGCSRNGYCLNGTCFCRPGFEGADCVFNGSRSRPRECAVVSLSSAHRVLASFFHPAGSKGGCPNGCGGHGHCVHGACYCEPGWRGRSCEIARCPGGCSGHGACFSGVCRCHSGYEGDDCSININRGICPNACSTRGVCTNGVCACDVGYRGVDCSAAPGQCLGNCSAKGECIDGKWYVTPQVT